MQAGKLDRCCKGNKMGKDTAISQGSTAGSSPGAQTLLAASSGSVWWDCVAPACRGDTRIFPQLLFHRLQSHLKGCHAICPPLCSQLPFTCPSQGSAPTPCQRGSSIEIPVKSKCPVPPLA